MLAEYNITPLPHSLYSTEWDGKACILSRGGIVRAASRHNFRLNDGVELGAAD